MKGGYQILDLRNIGLELKAIQQTITNVEILNQLRELRNHIEKGHNYAKGLNNALKCVMIRYRDAKNGEKEEVCQFCDIVSSNSSLNFDIIGKDLKIQVVFEEKTDDDGNKYFDIKSAKYYFTKNQNIEGNLNIEGDLGVTGESNFSDDANFESDVTIENDLEVVGNITGNSIIENMTGYSMALQTVTGYTLESIFCSAVKNGNKLTFVFALNITRTEDDLSGNPRMINITIPSDVGEKLYPVTIGTSSVLAVQNASLYTSPYSSNNRYCALIKVDNTSIYLRFDDSIHSITKNQKYYCRIEFTFLLNDSLIS